MSKNTLFNRAFGGFSFVKDDYVRQCKIIVADYQKRCAKIDKNYKKSYMSIIANDIVVKKRIKKK